MSHPEYVQKMIAEAYQCLTPEAYPCPACAGLRGRGRASKGFPAVHPSRKRVACGSFTAGNKRGGSPVRFPPSWLARFRGTLTEQMGEMR